MLTEAKILVDNIKRFRHLITEAVSQGDMIKYIQEHEWIYIYYAGDGKNKRGWRTIRPYVLGTSKAGNTVLRAWQDRGKSVSYSTKKRGEKHDYWTDDSDGKMKPGWRMFLLDKIEELYPIGKKFHNDDGTVMIPPDYKEGSDADMTSIIKYVSTKTKPEIQPAEVPTATGAKKTKWDNFTRGNKNNRKITAEDILKLRNIVRDVYKEKIGNFLVIISNNNEFGVINAKDKHKVPEQAVVGSLTNLYDTIVKGNAPADADFFNTVKNKVQTERKKKEQSEIKENELPTIPFDRKPFFKQ
jgi:hypothetical protein